MPAGRPRRAQLRHRWRFWLAIAALASVVGGLVLAAAAAGRRTEAALPQFAAVYGFDSDEYAFANDLGAVPISVVPTWLVVTLAIGVLVVSNLLAIGPALVASRSKPARLLQPSQLNAV